MVEKVVREHYDSISNVILISQEVPSNIKVRYGLMRLIESVTDESDW